MKSVFYLHFEIGAISAKSLCGKGLMGKIWKVKFFLKNGVFSHFRAIFHHFDPQNPLFLIFGEKIFFSLTLSHTETTFDDFRVCLGSSPCLLASIWFAIISNVNIIMKHNTALIHTVLEVIFHIIFEKYAKNRSIKTWSCIFCKIPLLSHFRAILSKNCGLSLPDWFVFSSTTQLLWKNIINSMVLCNWTQKYEIWSMSYLVKIQGVGVIFCPSWKKIMHLSG